MIYLSGVTADKDGLETRLIEAGIGLMLNPGNSYRLRAHRYPWWAADNGCYAETPEKPFDEDRWIDQLGWLADRGTERCLFATAPDVYPDSRASLERGLPFAPILREMGFPVAIVAQGSEPIDYPWDEFDVLFIGGERNERHPRSEWKTSHDAEKLVHEGRRHGVAAHMGRVNSPYRLERAREMGCSSADGTFLKYRKRRLATDQGDERLGRGEAEIALWLEFLDHNPILWQWETPSHPNHRRQESR